MSALTLLLIEDNLELQFLFKTALKRLGHTVLVCGIAADVPSILTNERPHLIITDLTIGSTDIASFTDMLVGTRAPIIVLSGREDLAVWANKLNACASLKKPVRLQEFRDAVANILDSKYGTNEKENVP